QSFAFRQPLSFDEEFVESRMRTISPVRRKRELEITGQLQSTGFAGGIPQSHAADFGVVFRGDRNFRDRLARPTPPPKLCFVRRETPSVTALGRSPRFMGVAPSCSACQVPYITKWARRVAGCIGAPARHVQVQPTQVAAAGVGHGNGAGSI